MAGEPRAGLVCIPARVPGAVPGAPASRLAGCVDAGTVCRVPDLVVRSRLAARLNAEGGGANGTFDSAGWAGCTAEPPGLARFVAV